MILHEVPYRGIFHVEGEGWFQKSGLSLDRVSNRRLDKLKHWIGEGDYFCGCYQVFGDILGDFMVDTQNRYIWIGCDQEVIVFNPAASEQNPKE